MITRLHQVVCRLRGFALGCEKSGGSYAANIESTLEKSGIIRWLHPDIVVGIGYWGHTPYIIHHPQSSIYNLSPGWLQTALSPTTSRH
jgi:hypothetical protein